MSEETDPNPGAKTAPAGRPPRRALLDPMLAGTRRAIVPVRRAFIQRPKKAGESRGAGLAHLARDSSALDAYLLIHAMASSSEPYAAAYPAATWVQLARLDESATPEAAKSRWSKIVTKLETLALIERERHGNEMRYRLLHESGDGTPYTRPKGTSDGHWLRLPYVYWADEYDKDLTHPEKIMLLIALDLPDGFKLPLHQASAWYGISESTARRGLRGLEKRGLLGRESGFVVSPRSPTGWAEELQYTLQGPFSKEAVHAAQAAVRPSVRFDEEGKA